MLRKETERKNNFLFIFDCRRLDFLVQFQIKIKKKEEYEQKTKQKELNTSINKKKYIFIHTCTYYMG